MLAAGNIPAGVIALAFAFQREAEGIDEQLAALRRVGGDDRHARDKENVHAAQPTGLSGGRGHAEYRGSPADSALRVANTRAAQGSAPGIASYSSDHLSLAKSHGGNHGQEA